MANNLDYLIPASGRPVSTQETTIDSIAQHLQRVKVGLGVKGGYDGDLAFGLAPSASSIPVVISEDQILPLGTAPAASSIPVTLAEDQTVDINTSLFEVTGSAAALNGNVIASTNVSRYRYVSLQITHSSSTNEVAFEGSNDNSNWFPIALLNTRSSWQVVASSEVGIYYGPICVKYFRARINNYIGGTTSGVAEFTISGDLHAKHVRTELAYPADLTDTLGSGINAGQVGSMNYKYANSDNKWHRTLLETSTPAPTSTVLAELVRTVGPVYTSLGRRDIFVAATDDPILMSTASSGTVVSLGYIWRPSGATKRIALQKVTVSMCNDAAATGIFSVSLNSISTAPSGTFLTPVKQEATQPTSSCHVVISPTSAPTRGSNINHVLYTADFTGMYEFNEVLEGKGLIAGSGGSGWEVKLKIHDTLSIKPKFATTFTWTEE